MSQTQHIEVYTDGSATVADKPGGYGYVLVINKQKHSEGAGVLQNATNNDAELEAAIQGLVAAYKFIGTLPTDEITGPYPRYTVTLVSDSQIILGWADGTYRFKQTNKLQKYEALKALVVRMHARTRWVKGHSGDEHNERCDQLANAARKTLEEPKLNPRKERKKKNKELKNTVLNKNIHIDEGIVLIHYKGVLKRIDLTTNTVEDYTVSSQEI